MSERLKQRGPISSHSQLIHGHVRIFSMPSSGDDAARVPSSGDDAARVGPRANSLSETAIALCAGGFGGACLAFVGAPFDTVKVRQQISHTHPVPLVRSIVGVEGVRGLWRGAASPIIASVAQFAIVFAGFDFNRKVLVPQLTGLPEGDLRATGLAGSLVAVPTSFLYTPFDRVKCVMQAEGRRIANGGVARFASTWACALHLWRGGRLFRGFWITLARDAPAWAAYFMVYNAAKRQLSSAALDGHAELSVGASLAAGGLAGASTWAVALPADVIKTRYQAHTYHHTYGHAARAVFARYGVLGFFSGGATMVLGGVPRDAACFCGVEVATRALTLLFAGETRCAATPGAESRPALRRTLSAA